MTVEDFIFERAGLRRAVRFAPPFCAWIAVASKVGKFPTAVEYAEECGVTERTAWRHRARIRRVLSEDEFRSVVMSAAERYESHETVMDIEIPEVLARAS